MHKAAHASSDGVILDLEDGVPPARKIVARGLTLRALEEMPFGRLERLVRINPPTSPWGIDDLEAIRGARAAPETVIVPKADGPETVVEVARMLEGTSIQVLPLIESARGLMAAPAIAACHPRVNGLLFGAGDFLLELGGLRTPQTLLYPRALLVIAAAAANIVAVDTPYLRLGDLAGLEADSRAAAELGFAGKAVIHPEQVPVVNHVFTPSPDRVAWAQRVLAQVGQHDPGVFVVDGEMADSMTVRVAQRVLATARALEVAGER